jgi:ABC-type Mn2+/Zn2+ transport system ATPase subunit
MVFPMPSILSVKDLNVSYEGRHVLKDVTFDLGPAESLAIIGPNGAGKTALLKALLGLVPHEGSVAWGKAARTAYVPQKIDADLHLPVTLRNLLEAKARILKLSKAAVNEAIKAAEIPSDVSDTPVGHLSGGQFQKSLIAFALLGHPTVLLLDEPTASLDELAEARIFDLLGELRTRRKMTIIFVSHDLSVVPSVATRVLCLNKAAVCFGKPHEALTPDVFEKLYAAPHRYVRHPSKARHREDV